MNYQENAIVLNEYLQWLRGALEQRLQRYFSSVNIVTEHYDADEEIFVNQASEIERLSFQKPSVSYSNAQLPEFIRKHKLDVKEQLLLLLSLAPHVNPAFFHEIIYKYLPHKGGDFPQLGCVKGEQYRGYLPTGETALFLLAGNDIENRLVVRQLFTEDHFFGCNKVLWLDTVPEGEPIMSGRIVLDPEYVNLFLDENYSRPRFGAEFPAERITTQLEWEDLVLNPQTTVDIQQIKKWLKHKHTLLDINKRLKPGYRALFYGPPGTGKTLTACLLGKKEEPTGFESDVYRVDLSLIVSKFIGETEKNLSKLFDKAEHKNWILFFDEADALFGKRTNIRDAHDKYANQEISYLLQRVENYDGLVILASNFKSNIDAAFSRRFQAIIQFPMPNQDERLKLWKMILPNHMCADENLLDYISYMYEISGASIINVAQTCFLKNMDDVGKISLIKKTDIENAIAQEFNKEGKVLK